jgi:hypothetical protein
VRLDRHTEFFLHLAMQRFKRRFARFDCSAWKAVFPGRADKLQASLDDEKAMAVANDGDNTTG